MGAPKKSVRISRRRNRLKKLAPKKVSNALTLDKSVSFDFQVITPLMQIEERNKAYNFFRP